jgi:hypothetical protein
LEPSSVNEGDSKASCLSEPIAKRDLALSSANTHRVVEQKPKYLHLNYEYYDEIDELMRVLQTFDSIQLARILRADGVSQTVINTSGRLARLQMIKDIYLKEGGMDKDQLLSHAGAGTK